MRRGFTLIEVMVAVMIIAVVIMALLQMYANNTHIFSVFKEKIKTNQYSSLLFSNQNYGFENTDIHLDDLITEFQLEDDLRRKLKEMKAEILYQIVEEIDLSENSETNQTNEMEDTQTVTPTMIIELGKTILKLDNSSNALLRIRVQ